MLIAVTALVLASAGPASAQDLVTAGAGAGGGFEYAPAPNQLCGLPTAGAHYAQIDFELTHAANYDVVDADFDPMSPDVVGTATSVAIASFVGTTETRISIKDVRQAPQGATPGPCPENPLATLVPAPVPIDTVQIDGVGLPGTNPPGSVNCTKATADPGYYLRVNTSVVFDFTATCNIEGNVIAGSANQLRVRHRIVGNQIPCVQGVVGDFPFPPTQGIAEGCSPPLMSDQTSILQTEFEADTPTA